LQEAADLNQTPPAATIGKWDGKTINVDPQENPTDFYFFYVNSILGL
jgi:hypothetical protein